jgi:hypothetical protein
MEKLSWKPVRRGNLYCSSACGRGCTIKEYRETERLALCLANRLAPMDTDVKGGRWEICLSENLGWHYSVSKGAISVHGDSGGRRIYSVFLNLPGPWGGNMAVTANIPEAGIRKILNNARLELKAMVALARHLGVS